eukprot:363970-Chlamydomonas_euryale.AAC.17
MLLQLLNKYSNEFAVLRIMYMANPQKSIASRSVFVSDIPGVASNTKRQTKGMKKQRKNARALPHKKDDDAAHQDTLAEVEAPQEERAIGLDNVLLLDGVGGPINHDALRGTFMSEPVKRKFDYNPKDASLVPSSIAKTILNANVPVQTMVENEFETVYPGAVNEVHMVKNQAELWPLYNEYNAVKQKLEDYLDECEFRMKNGLKLKRRKAMIFPIAMGEWGKSMGYGKGLLKSVDAFEYWDARLRELDRLIASELQLSGKMVWPSAFITFKNRKEQTAAAIGLHHHDTRYWLVQNAPEPRELVWSNLGMTAAIRSTMWGLMWVLFWLGTFFFMIPVAAVQGLINTGAASLPGLNAPVVAQLLQGILPGLALIIFIAMVPFLLRLLMLVSGSISESQTDMGVVSRFFIFQTVVVFFGSVFAGAFFNQITTWINNPGQVISILGTAIPQVCTFFIIYVAARSLIAQPLQALRIGKLVMFAIFTNITPSPKVRAREAVSIIGCGDLVPCMDVRGAWVIKHLVLARARIWQQQFQDFGTVIANHSISILLGVVYSCVNPLMCPFVLLYFMVNYGIQAYEQVYVFRRLYESAGQVWPKFVNHVMFGIYVQHIVMIGLLGIKKFVYTPLLIPAPFIAIIFHMSIYRLYNRPWSFTSYHDATDLDRMDALPEDAVDPKEELLEEGGAESMDAAEAYKSPCFKVHPGEILALLDEAKAMEVRVAKYIEVKAWKTKEEGELPVLPEPEEAGADAVADKVPAKQVSGTTSPAGSSNVETAPGVAATSAKQGAA